MFVPPVSFSQIYSFGMSVFEQLNQDYPKTRDSFKSNLNTPIVLLCQAEYRADYSERRVVKLERDVERLEGSSPIYKAYSLKNTQVKKSRIAQLESPINLD